jgi:purine-binding chemotaxis protein CheW
VETDAMDMQIPEHVRSVAREASARAAALASPPRQFLTFSAAGETYAMPIAAIKEIIEHGAVTAIPLMPAFIRGVINLRGAVVPVIDLAARLGFPASTIGRRTCIVIVEMQHDDERFDMGLVVEGVSEVLELATSDLEPPPSFGARVRSDFIEAMARIRGRFVIVMRLGQVLSVDEVSGLARMAQGGAERG